MIMKAKQQKQLTVQQEVLRVMEQHVAHWQSVAAMKAQYDRFVRNMKKIGDHLKVLETDLASVKAVIPERKSRLVAQLFPVTSALGVYAAEEGDRRLLKRMKVTLPDLERMKADDLVRFSSRVIRTGNDLLAAAAGSAKKAPRFHISDYGLTEQHLGKLKLELGGYVDALSTYREARLQRKKSKVKLTNRINENELILRRKIDRMMHLFRDIHPTFYTAYIRSRVPADSRAGAKPEAQRATPSGEDTAAEKPGEPLPERGGTAAQKSGTAAQKSGAAAQKRGAAQKKGGASPKPRSAPGPRKSQAGGGNR